MKNDLASRFNVRSARNSSADNPRDFFAASYQPRARLGQNRFYAGCVAPQVMRGVGKMCTIQIARRTAIIRQIQISKTAPMNPAIR